MPPKKQPSQAGKFKPLMRPAKKLDAPPPASSSATADVAAPSSSSPSAVAGGGGRTSESAGRGGGRGRGRGRGEGRGGGRGGRTTAGGGARGRGGGRFVVPTGATFFTGEAARRGGEAGGGVGGGGASAFSRGAARTVRGTTTIVGGGGGGLGAARSTAGSMAAAAARAGAGEGEEFIVAEMADDVDEFGEGGDDDDGLGGGKDGSASNGPSRGGRRNDGASVLFDDENRNDDDRAGDRRGAMADHDGISNAFVYDSDSSAEEGRAIYRAGGKRRGGEDAAGGGGPPPTQLPFPVAPHQRSMYDCQEEGDDYHGEEKKTPDPRHASSSSSAGVVVTASSPSKLRDPPLHSPFMDIASVSAESNDRAEATDNSWFLMKFPTRLPRSDASSSSSSASRKKAAARVKSELFDEGDNNVPDLVGSSSHADASVAGEVGALASSATASSGPLGYDDTLKDAAAGRYGRIVVRKSGKMELIVGGGGNGQEVRLLVHEGLQCGFRQEAVSIDPDNATFVSLGCVDKSLVVTPDIERAFAFS